MEVLSLLLESVPSFQLPLAITETLHDLLISRDRTLNVVYGLFAGAPACPPCVSQRPCLPCERLPRSGFVVRGR